MPRLSTSLAALALAAALPAAQAQQGVNLTAGPVDYTTWSMFGSAQARNFTPGNGFTYSVLELNNGSPLYRWVVATLLACCLAVIGLALVGPYQVALIGSFALVTLLMKNHLMDNLAADYIRTAVALSMQTIMALPR